MVKSAAIEMENKSGATKSGPDFFKDLTKNNENNRVNSGLKLLHKLLANSENGEKELKHVLRRLIRGVGASTTNSRAGFYTTLVGFLLNSYPIDTSIENLINIAKQELRVGNTIVNKEDADAVVGHILTCNALLHSQDVSEMNDDDIRLILSTLITSSKYRTYHNSLAFSLIIDMIEKSTREQFKKVEWPLLEPVIRQPWNKQNINTVQCWIKIQRKFPKIINEEYMKSVFGFTELLNPKSFDFIFKIFWESGPVNIITHPAFECFGNYIAKSQCLEEFWIKKLNISLIPITKIKEIFTIKIFTDILLNVEPNKIKISIMLTNNLIEMMINGLKRCKNKKDEILKAFYDDFFNALLLYMQKMDNDLEKVNVIQKLILHPGILNIELYLPQRMIHQMIENIGFEGIKKLYATYKNIFLEKIVKEPNNPNNKWLRNERELALGMLHTLITHKNVQQEFQWRGNELQFMMVYSFFNVDCEGNVIPKANENDNVNDEFSSQFKNIFYSSLQSKLLNLKKEKEILLNLIDFCNEILNRKNYNRFIKNCMDKNILDIWSQMYKELKQKKRKLSASDDKLQLVFHILILHMALQLFREPEMAQAAILDLEVCMKKSKTGRNKHKETAVELSNDSDREEPEWIEVVVDLFLHLLSQNASSLRNVVDTVFTHLCENMTLSSVHQILSVLDMTKNPLTGKEEEMDMDEDDDTKEINDEIESNNDALQNNMKKTQIQLNGMKSRKRSVSENESNDEHDDDSNDDGNSDSDDKDDEDDDEENADDNDDLMEFDEDDSTGMDTLRNAVSEALRNVDRETDLDSVNLDDMEEEEGRRLDEALASAFKVMKKKGANKRSKEYRIQTTTSMHFRLRVLHLIEIYIQHNPNLLIALEIMIALFNMTEFCSTKDLQTLANKVQKVLAKLTSIRKFAEGEVVTDEEICEYLRIILEKKLKASVIDIQNRLKAKCCIFLVINCRSLENSEDLANNSVLNLVKTYLNDFINSRNPTINTTLLNELFKLRWPAAWNLALTLAQDGLLQSSTRPFRRIQIIDLIEKLYRNHELIKINPNLAKTSLKVIEKSIQKHIVRLSGSEKVSHKEFLSILDLIITAEKCHIKNSLKTYFDREILCKSIQDIRNKLRLLSLGSYGRVCKLFGIKIVRNFELSTPNGEDATSSNSKQKANKNGYKDSENEDGTNMDNKVEKKRKTKKSKIDSSENGSKTQSKSEKIDFRKLKKLKKAKRMEISSAGLSDSINFSNSKIDYDIADG